MRKTLMWLVVIFATLIPTAIQAQQPTQTPETAGSGGVQGNDCPANPAPPKLSGPLREGATQLSGTGSAYTSPCTVKISLYDIGGGVDNPPLVSLAATGGQTVDPNGDFKLTLSEPLREGQKIAVVETFNGTGGTTVPEISDAAKFALEVVVVGDWGRVKGYFTSGILISQGQDSFSQSSLYMGFTLDKAWSLPAYYHRVKEKPKKTSKDKIATPATRQRRSDRGPALNATEIEEVSEASLEMVQAGSVQGASADVSSLKGKTRWWRPGINTYFDVRLTQIPVSACSADTSSTSNQSSPCTPAASGAPTPTPTPSPTPAPAPSPTPGSLETFLSSRKTARLAVGAYFPFTWTTWTNNKTPNALFIAPLAKVGFDTPAGSLNQIQPASSVNSSVTNSGTVQAVNPTSFYNFYAYGARIGHYALTASTNRAPDLISYLDVTFGRFSNLETLIQPQGASPTNPVVRRRLYRIQLEGLLKIPTTPLVIGLNANVGQEALGVGGGNIVQRAGDDLRFLFGAKFDVAKLLSHITKNAP